MRTSELDENSTFWLYIWFAVFTTVVILAAGIWISDWDARRINRGKDPLVMECINQSASTDRSLPKICELIKEKK